MIETRHTPGPWEWENHPHNGEPIALTGGGDTDVLLATGSSLQAWLIVNEADSRLIAAAPDLLAACQYLRRFLAEYDTDREFHSSLRQTLDDAITKATT